MRIHLSIYNYATARLRCLATRLRFEGNSFRRGTDPGCAIILTADPYNAKAFPTRLLVALPGLPVLGSPDIAGGTDRIFVYKSLA